MSPYSLYCIGMGRRRKAWLSGKTARWYEYGTDAKRIHRSQTFTTIANAKRWVREYNARADLRALNEIIPTRVCEAVREFMIGCESLAMNTKIHYAGSLGMMHPEIKPDVFVHHIRPADIERVIVKLHVGRKPATVKKHLAAVDRFFNWCISRGYAESNPAKRVTSRPRGTFVRQKRTPTDAELARFIAALDTDDRRVGVWIAITTGLDRMVIASLTRDNIDIEAQCFRVVRRKTNKSLTVPIHPCLVQFLRERVSRTRPRQPLLTGLSRQHWRRDWFRKAASAADLPDDFRFQSLRSVAATRLIRSGSRPADVQSLLGHSSLSTTLRHYYEVDTEVRRSFGRIPLPGFQDTTGPSKG